MKYDLDMLLQQALSPKEEPGDRLNGNILIQAKEREYMGKSRFKLSAGVAAAAMTLVFSTVGVYAAAKYFSADKVAEAFSDRLLSKAFQTEDAILLNESQEYAGYKITLLGVVSGEGLSEYTEWDEKGQIVTDKTYIVTAIENTDGTPRPDVFDDAYGEDSFYVSPYIKGLSMVDYNAHTLGGGYSEDVFEGIQYRIMECDNIEIFAGRGLYLGVTGGDFYQAGAFVMDATSGEISRNADYVGVNALFELPIPKELGDEAAVEKYLQEKSNMYGEDDEDNLGTDDISNNAELQTDDVLAENNGTEKADTEELVLTEDIATDMDALYHEVKTWTLADFRANSKCVLEQELSIDEEGFISYAHSFGASAQYEANVRVDMLFEEMVPGLSKAVTVSGDSPVYIETYELLENGNIMLRIYEYDR